MYGKKLVQQYEVSQQVLEDRHSQYLTPASMQAAFEETKAECTALFHSLKLSMTFRSQSSTAEEDEAEDTDTEKDQSSSDSQDSEDEDVNTVAVQRLQKLRSQLSRVKMNKHIIERLMLSSWDQVIDPEATLSLKERKESLNHRLLCESKLSDMIDSIEIEHLESRIVKRVKQLSNDMKEENLVHEVTESGVSTSAIEWTTLEYMSLETLATEEAELDRLHAATSTLIEGCRASCRYSVTSLSKAAFA